MNQKHISRLDIFTSILGALGLLLFVAGCPIGDLTLPGINQDPTANAGADLQRCVGQEVALDALSSSDPDGDSLFYNWSSVRCAGSCDLDSANIPTPTFTPTNGGLYEFSLTVTDDRGGSDLDTIRVVVVECDGPNPCEDIECPPGQVCNLGTRECEPKCEAVVCVDDDPCTNDLCIGDACHHIAIDCDDGEFCNGVESCVDGACVEGTNPCVAPQTCDEDNDACAERVDFATLVQGASIAAFSSRLDDPDQCNICADPRDVIGGSFSHYFTGETGNFIFDIGDLDQFVVVDLGQTRVVDRVGAAFSDGTGDREVFDFVEILASVDGLTFVQQGIVGLEGVGDPLDFTLVSPVFFDITPAVQARFVRYNFGRYSPDWGGGSRILDVFAEGLLP